MWQVLFYVTPLTVGIALVVLGAAAVVVARWRRRSPRAFAREARWLLGAAAAVYLLVLAGPMLGWDKVGTTGWDVTWNPLSAYEELRQAAVEPEGAYLVLGPGPEETLYYGARELSPEEVEQARREADPADAAFYRYPTTDSGVVWFDAHGHDVDLDTRAELEALPPPLLQAEESAALIVEEKTVNALLFVPIGILAFAAFPAWWARLAAGPALSLAIETVQWALAAGRSADVGDLLVNTAGSATGVGMVAVAALCLGLFRTNGTRHRGPATEEPEVRHPAR
ncbi:VanZ family protein [Thermobifida halotolerans]|uniref:VanZ family protein n=1 Tax=Thermobifida halotolerans TaxID=483545 RepID=A0AA97LZ54_9ACTN|nr:VanZ family protein [Thermobifida halotolerans]UOE21027.1 VanZ family protein [Thermobifida halotolerans]